MKNLETVKKRQKKNVGNNDGKQGGGRNYKKDTIIHKILMKGNINKIKFVLNHKNREVKIRKKKMKIKIADKWNDFFHYMYFIY